MKKRKIYLRGTTMLLVMAGCSKNDTPVVPTEENENSVQLAGKGGGPSANGQGSLTTIAGDTRHFSFHANTTGNGTVQGSGVLNITAGGTQIKFDINCLNVVGNVATMSGTIRQSNNPVAVVGTGCWFRVVDNGEGSNAPADQITLFAFFPNNPNPPTCANNLLIGLNLVEGGNIQVKP